jgi:hypothetical protein
MQPQMQPQRPYQPPVCPGPPRCMNGRIKTGGLMPYNWAAMWVFCSACQPELARGYSGEQWAKKGSA